MRCLLCEFEGEFRPLHQHLAEQHPDLVRFETRGERHYYKVVCPTCGADYEQRIKPRLADPEFLEEYRREIRLVALDMLLNHLVGEHLTAETTETAGDTGPEPKSEVNPWPT